jgi:soluble lytic murein transglycosylase-like protein
MHFFTPERETRTILVGENMLNKIIISFVIFAITFTCCISSKSSVGEVNSDLDLSSVSSEVNKSDTNLMKTSKEIIISTSHLKETVSNEVSTTEKVYTDYIFEIVSGVCSNYLNVDPLLVMGIIQVESEFNPKCYYGGCYGLMQVNKSQHTSRIDNLNVSDLYDPESNIRVGVDIFSECLSQANDDVIYALMIYNEGYSSASPRYNSGVISKYSKKVINAAYNFGYGG